jgi:hypothetical protein
MIREKFKWRTHKNRVNLFFPENLDGFNCYKKKWTNASR